MKNYPLLYWIKFLPPIYHRPELLDHKGSVHLISTKINIFRDTDMPTLPENQDYKLPLWTKEKYMGQCI